MSSDPIATRQRPGAGDFVALGAAGRHGFWTYTGGALLVAAAYFAASVAAVTGLMLAGGEIDPLALVGGDRVQPALLLAVFMVPSLGLLAGTLAVTRWVHGRPVTSLLTAATSVRWPRVALAAAVWAGLTAAFEIVAFGIDPGNYSLAFDPARFLPVAIVALLLVPVQSAAEEIFFRGYLLQGLGVVLGRPWAALVLTSAGFGLVHGSNPEMAEFGRAFLVYYVGMGLLLGLVTLLDGGVEIAVGAHAANNLYGALAVSFPGSVLDMPAVFRMARFPVVQMSLFGALTGALFLLVLWRRCDWPPLGAVLGPAPRPGAAPTSGGDGGAGQRQVEDPGA